MTTKNTFKEHALRVIAIVGLIAVLLLGAWGIIQLAFFIPTLFTGGGSVSTAKETLSVSAPLGVSSEATFPVSWTHKGGSGQYAYTLSYSCADGVSMKAPVPTGALQAVPCNTPFNYLNATTSTALAASIAGDKSMSTTITVSATKLSTGVVTASATANTTVNPVKKAAAPAKTTVSSNSGAKYVASGRTTNLYGSPDLAVYITSNFGQVRVGTRVALQFVIQNVGSNVAPGGWTFSASLPYSPIYTYQSAAQQALYPGDKIVYTLSYDAQYGDSYNGGVVAPCNGGWSYPCTQTPTIYGGPGTCNAYGPCNATNYYAPNVPGYQVYSQSASIQADNYNQVWENNESNNYASITYSVF